MLAQEGCDRGRDLVSPGDGAQVPAVLHDKELGVGNRPGGTLRLRKGHKRITGAMDDQGRHAHLLGRVSGQLIYLKNVIEDAGAALTLPGEWGGCLVRTRG